VRVSGITDRLAVVSWETDEPGDSAADYGIAASYGLRASDGRFLQLHELSLTELNASTIYHYRVLSKDATGNGPASSADLTFTTLAVPDKTPPVITNVRVEQLKTDSAIVLWETNEVADSFVEYGQTASYGQSSADRTFLLYHSILLQGLSPDKEYHYRALSADSSGNTGMGTDLTFRTAKGGGGPDTTPPMISGVTVSGISDTRAVIMWTTNELADSEVEYGNGTAYGLRASDASDTTVHSLVLDGLKPMTGYHFRVKSTDVIGNGPAVSADAVFTTAGNPDVVGPKISNVKVTKITRTGATITWTTDEPADSVVDYGNSTSYGQKLTSKLNVVSHSVIISGLSAGKAYHFRVGSTDPAGNTASPGTDQTFSTLRTGTTTTPFPWLWVALAIVVVGAMAAGLAYYTYKVRKAPRDALTQPTPIRGIGSVTNPAPTDTSGGDAETLQMDEEPSAAPAAAEGGWEEEGASVAAAAAVAPPKPVEPVPVRHIRCPKCKTRIPLFTDGPSRILCPNCGTTGEYRPKGKGAADGGQRTATDLASGATRPAAVAATPNVQWPSPMAAAPSQAAPTRMTRCSNCGSPVPIHSTSFPVRITCPGCGKTGIYKGPRGA
jgi:ribosomal protein S27E